MSISDALSSAGLIVSFLFGIWGIYLAVRRTKYPASLTFVREQSIALLDDFATKLPNLSLLYKGIPINKSVVLVSGYLANDGNADITPEMVENPLTCRLPGTCSWLEFRITTTAAALQVESVIKSLSDVQLKLGLFRRDESFAFQALALLDEEHANKTPTAFAEEIRWTHRIASLGDIKTILMPVPQARNRKVRFLRKTLLPLIVCLYIFLGLSQITGLGPLGSVPSIAYEFESGGKKSRLTLIPNRDGTTTIHDIETGEERKTDLSIFSKTGTFVPIRSERHELDKLKVVLGLFTLFLAGVLVFFAFANDYKRYRIRKLVSATTRES